jgi:hypothetical protein
MISVLRMRIVENERESYYANTMVLGSTKFQVMEALC